MVQAVESLFRIIDRGVTDRENAEHIKGIKESLNALEGGRVLMFKLSKSAKKDGICWRFVGKKLITYYFFN